MIVQKTKKQPKKSAAFGGRLLVLFWGLKYSHFLGVQNKIYTYWVYLMEHICFEVQLCIQKSILHEFCGIPGIWQIRCRAVSYIKYWFYIKLRLCWGLCPPPRTPQAAGDIWGRNHVRTFCHQKLHLNFVNNTRIVWSLMFFSRMAPQANSLS